MKYFLILLCIWPFCHGPETHTVTLNSRGMAIIPLKHHHDLNACTFQNVASHGTEELNGKQKVHVQGKPGEVVTVTCKK